MLCIENLTTSFSVVAGWLIDGMGEPAMEKALVKVREGIIVSIQDAGDYDLTYPDVINLSHCTILPGLVDCHVHLFMSGTCDAQLRQYQLRAPFADVQEVISRHLKQQLSHGVVAVRDGGDFAGHVLHYKRERFASEELPIYLRSAGKAWRTHGRYGSMIGHPPLQGETLAQAIAREEEIVDHVKILNSGINSLTQFGRETAPQFSLAQLKAAVLTSRDSGLTTMVHANGQLPVKLAIEAGCHSLEHGFFMGGENLKRLAERNVAWVPTAYTMKAYKESFDLNSPESGVAEQNLDHQLNQISRTKEYGITVALGTDCGSLGVNHGSAVKEEMKILMEAGYSVEGAIKCTTFNGAKVLGLEGEVGCISPGMPATFVAALGGPTCLPDSLDALELIMIRGKKWVAKT